MFIMGANYDWKFFVAIIYNCGEGWDLPISWEVRQ